jgi:hypothetical protein
MPASKKKGASGAKAAFFAVAMVSYIVYIITLLCVRRPTKDPSKSPCKNYVWPIALAETSSGARPSV